MAGLKIRLDDGSEVGPMDLGMVQTWFQQGLIGRDSMVLASGSTRWVRLAEAVDLGKWNAPQPSGRRRAAGGRGASSAFEGGGQRLRFVVAAVLYIVLAAAALVAWIWPDRLRPELDGTPWLQIGLTLAALGLLLVRGWNLGRRVARLVTVLALASAFPLAGLSVARGMRGEGLVTLGSAALLAAGLVAFLAPRLSRPAAAGSLLLVALGAVGFVRFAPAESTGLSGVEAWATQDRRISDPEIGLELSLPQGWLALKPGNPLVASLPGARLTLAQPRVGGYALLLSEPPPANVAMLEHYLDDVIARRRAAASEYDEDWRRDGRLGALTSRRASARRGGPDGRVVERIVTVRDADRYLALVVSVPEAGGGRALEEAEALEAAVSVSGVRSRRQRAAVQAANLELPHLSVSVIERLVEAGGPASPAELFRRASAASARGLGSLGAAGAQELRALTAATLAGLPSLERAQLADYLLRVGAGQPTQADEDERMRQLMKAATVRRASDERRRLEALNERAIRAALGDPDSASASEGGAAGR